jgi:hypothetical protein
MQRLAAEQNLETMRPELGTKPRVYYKNLWRYSTCFVGGTLSAEANGIVDCVEGADVRLLKDGRTIAQTQSDNYGDFRFDRLQENSGRHDLEIAVPGRPKKTINVVVGESVSIGEIRL